MKTYCLGKPSATLYGYVILTVKGFLIGIMHFFSYSGLHVICAHKKHTDILKMLDKHKYQVSNELLGELSVFWSTIRATSFLVREQQLSLLLLWSSSYIAKRRWKRLLGLWKAGTAISFFCNVNCSCYQEHDDSK